VIHLKNMYSIIVSYELVPVFKISYELKIITISYYDHHDNVYKWRPKEY